jgi:hypothetical protein
MNHIMEAGGNQMHAVIDRFEGSKAVLLVGEDEHILVVEKKSLPADVHDGTWLIVETNGDQLVSAALDPAGEAQARLRIEAKKAALLRGDHLK